MAAPPGRPIGILILTGRNFVFCVVSLYIVTCRDVTSKLNEVKWKEIKIVRAVNIIVGVLAPLILNLGTGCR
jgi:hypothetical protein